MAVQEIETGWIFIRKETAAFGNDADWILTNDVAAATAAGTGTVTKGRHSDSKLAISLVAMTGNAIFSPFAGSVDVQLLEIAKGPSGAILVSHGAAVTVSVGTASVLTAAVGLGHFAFRLTSYTSINVAINNITLAVKLI